MRKSVLAFMGSPRKNGNSTVLARKIAEGAAAAGCRVESFYLHRMKIKPCSACDKCKAADDRFCVIKDDMQKLYPKIIAADALILASPIYFFTISAQLKLFMDRCYALGGPGGYPFKGKKIAIALTYGDVDPFCSGAVNALRTFQDAFAYLEADIVGSIYGTGLEPGEIAKNRAVTKEALALGKALAGS
jgi:multimeric flavodoxin WrbA